MWRQSPLVAQDGGRISPNCGDISDIKDGDPQVRISNFSLHVVMVW